MSLKDDKERLLRMVSRLELDRHHLQSLQNKKDDCTMSSAPTGSSGHLRLEAYDKEQVLESATSAQVHSESLYVGALTDLIEMNNHSTQFL